MGGHGAMLWMHAAHVAEICRACMHVCMYACVQVWTAIQTYMFVMYFYCICAVILRYLCCNFTAFALYFYCICAVILLYFCDVILLSDSNPGIHTDIQTDIQPTMQAD